MRRIMILFLAMLMMSAVSGLEISSPKGMTYGTTQINLSISHADTLDVLRYSVDGKPLVHACDNCSGYDASITFAEGSHTVYAVGTTGNQTYDDSVGFTIALPDEDFSIEIVSPKDKEYNSTGITLRFKANTTVDEMRYAVDGDAKSVACEDCREYSKDIVLEEGDHKVMVEAFLGDVRKTREVEFEIDLPEEETDDRFTLTIVKPQARTYEPGKIGIEVSSNATLERIRVRFDGYDKSCQNCSRFKDEITLGEGNYTLRASGKLGETVTEKVLVFRVRNTTAVVDDEGNSSYGYNGPKFTTGFEKLPKMLESGEISDTELAEILSANQMNPGIVNRLIKTGLLGNKSLEAILDHQEFRPTGIWNKLLAFVGYKGNTYAAQIEKKYDLSAELDKRLVARDDLPRGLAKKVQSRIQAKSEEKGEEALETNKSRGKSLEVGKQKEPKRETSVEEDRIPPGQVKKSQDTASPSEGKKGGNDKKGGKGKR